MRQPQDPGPAGDPPPTGREPDSSVPAGGLIDPRAPHPGPEGVFPEIGGTARPEPSTPEPGPTPGEEAARPVSGGPGLVDPRTGLPGPALAPPPDQGRG